MTSITRPISLLGAGELGAPHCQRRAQTLSPLLIDVGGQVGPAAPAQLWPPPIELAAPNQPARPPASQPRARAPAHSASARNFLKNIVFHNPIIIIISNSSASGSGRAHQPLGLSRSWPPSSGLIIAINYPALEGESWPRLHPRALGLERRQPAGSSQPPAAKALVYPSKRRPSNERSWPPASGGSTLIDRRPFMAPSVAQLT